MFASFELQPVSSRHHLLQANPSFSTCKRWFAERPFSSERRPAFKPHVLQNPPICANLQTSRTCMRRFCLWRTTSSRDLQDGQPTLLGSSNQGFCRNLAQLRAVQGQRQPFHSHKLRRKEALSCKQPLEAPCFHRNKTRWLRVVFWRFLMFANSVCPTVDASSFSFKIDGSLSLLSSTSGTPIL